MVEIDDIFQILAKIVVLLAPLNVRLSHYFRQYDSYDPVFTYLHPMKTVQSVAKCIPI